MRTFRILFVAVVLIVIVLWIISIPRFGHGKNARLVATRASIQNIHSALETYRASQGSYPSEEQGLSVLPTELRGQRVPAESRPREITDPWGTPFRYRLIAGKPEIRSAGPDGQFDTQDDITK